MSVNWAHIGKRLFEVGAAVVLLLIFLAPRAHAAIPPPGPSSNSIGVTGSLIGDPPKQGATIATPTNGQSFTNQLITVSGLCPKDVLVKVYSNGVFVGSTTCNNGSYTIQVSLFPGQNQLISRVFDAAEQQGPDSNTVTVTYNAAQFEDFASLVTLTSVYARKGADPGKKLTWPILLSGGNGPYAVSVDWGDGQSPSLVSLRTPGSFDVSHTYSSAGVYRVTVRATDANGAIAFLQLVAVVNGNAAAAAFGGSNTTGTGAGGSSGSGSTSSSSGQNVNSAATSAQIRFLIITSFCLILFMIPTFWLGRKYELLALHRKIERDAKEFARNEASR